MFNHIVSLIFLLSTPVLFCGDGRKEKAVSPSGGHAKLIETEKALKQKGIALAHLDKQQRALCEAYNRSIEAIETQRAQLRSSQEKLKTKQEILIVTIAKKQEENTVDSSD